MLNFRMRNIVRGCLSAAVSCLLSCVEQNDCHMLPAGEIESVPIRVYVDEPQSAARMKSSFSMEDMERLTDLNIFVYRDGLLLEECCKYYDQVAEAMLSFPVGTDVFNIYMLGNVGRVSAPSYESRLQDVRHVVEDYAGFREHGVPVAGIFKDYRRGDPAEFPLKRLVGQFNVRMTDSAADAEYVIKDVRVMNCAMDVYPFSADSKAVMFTGGLQYADQASGDMLTDDDVDALNSGGSVPLYFLENLQGELLPGNTDPKKKIPSLLPVGAADRCTYVEVTADVTTPAARYTDCRYRFYPGRNETTDFSIVRNTLYEVVLDFTQNMVSEQEWRIEADEPDVVGVRMDKEEAMVIKGTEDMVYVQAFDNSGNLMDFDVEILSSSGKINVDKVRTSYLGQPGLGEALGLRFTSNVGLCGLYSYGSEPDYDMETVRISSRETYNGSPLYVKDVKVRVYDRLFPLLIRLERAGQDSGSPYEIVMRGRNPMKLGLSVSGTYVSKGSSLNISKSVRGVYRNVQNPESIYDNALNIDGVRFSALDVSAPSDLSRIDFHIKGEPDVSDDLLTMAYPKFSTSAELYTGPDSEAVLGPGSGMCPGKLPKFSDDSPYYITWLSGSSPVTRSYSYNDGKTYGSASYHGLLEAWITSANRASEFPNNYGSSYLFGLYKGVHAGDIDKSSPMYADFTPYEKMPFYVVNGGLVEYSTNLMFTGNLPRWPDEVVRGLEYDFLSCGRDLFSENSDGSVVARHHKMGMKVATWKQAIGSKVRTSLKSRYYTAQLYMTVNGASCWCGSDLTEDGYYQEVSE